MNICHICLERPWQYDHQTIHDGKKEYLQSSQARSTIYVATNEEEGNSEANGNNEVEN